MFSFVKGQVSRLLKWLTVASRSKVSRLFNTKAKKIFDYLVGYGNNKKENCMEIPWGGKRANMRRNISIVSEHLSRATEDPVVGTDASPVSASSSKLGYFCRTLQALDSTAEMEDGKDDDFYIIEQKSSMKVNFQ